MPKSRSASVGSQHVTMTLVPNRLSALTAVANTLPGPATVLSINKGSDTRSKNVIQNSATLKPRKCLPDETGQVTGWTGEVVESTQQ